MDVLTGINDVLSVVCIPGGVGNDVLSGIEL